MPALHSWGNSSMDIYWSVIYAVAGVGAALLVAFVIASAVLLGPWLAGRTWLQRRAAGGVPAHWGAPNIDRSAIAQAPATVGAARSRATATPRPRTRAA